MNESRWLETIRGLVRPVVTLLLVLAVIALAGYLAYRFADGGMATKAVDSVITMAGMAMAFWFGARAKK